MKKIFPQLLRRFAIFFIFHFLICALLTHLVSRLMAENGNHLTPTILLITLPLNVLSMPMCMVWFGSGEEIQQRYLGTGLGMIALLARRN